MILDDIVAQKKIRVKERKEIISPEEVYQGAIRATGDVDNNRFKEVLEGEGLSIIGEYKKASPSKGIIAPYFNMEEILKLYKELEIDAYSVLTEEDFFHGSDDNLRFVKSRSNTPILRKDFIIDFYQIHQARILGASGILLIASVLGKNLKSFYEECRTFKLKPLVEVHNREELELALECNSEIIGINNRNLKTFHTSLEVTEKLIEYIPKNKIIVSESGIHNIEDLRRVKEAGASAALIGEMFMRNINNVDFKREFKLFKGEENAY
ncbi:indole-3-glycerol phosphate synthase TrpC [Clostridium paraputrificum]|uniref:indole-3-glycerol phosphate synthase TrpC n=1 Tax=Clostridium paraputrificum TaxID=29363 RepID=UPI003D332C0D